MKILITTGIYPPDVGGPATYAKNLKEEWEKIGYRVKVVFFGLEKKLPTGLRHLYYFFRLLPEITTVNFILILDTFSVGLPALAAAKIFRKKTILRTGGDFLWEQYVQNHQADIILSDFYTQHPKLNFKEKVIFYLTKLILSNVDLLVFSTNWQRNIFIKAYQLKETKCLVIENFYPIKEEGTFAFEKKNFLWAGRVIKLKNLDRLQEAFGLAKRNAPGISLDLVSGVEQNCLVDKIKQSYALILPSLSEISPNFILEALKYNKPFIITKENGLNERLGDLGLSVNPLNASDIRDKILFLVDENNYKEVKRKIEGFSFNRSWHQIGEDFLTLYSKL